MSGQGQIGKPSIDPIQLLCILGIIGLLALIPLGCFGILSW